MTPGPGIRRRALEALVPAAVLVPGLLLLVRLAVSKYFSIDEFMHAHASWLTGRGWLPYRDFCDFHFPFLYQLLGGLWKTLPDDPRSIVFLRAGMLALVLLILLGAAFVNRREGLVASLSASAVLLTVAPFVIRATEIRHDTLAFALFLSSLGAMTLERIAPRARGALVGVLLGLAVWSSQKVLMYGLPVGALLLFQTLRRREPQGGELSSVGSIWSGGLLVAALAAAYLGVTNSWSGFLTYAIGWAFRWQAEYPPFSAASSLAPARDGWAFALGLSAAGLGATVSSLRRGRWPWNADLLLVLSFASSFGYFLLLKAPYDYNLIPFLGLMSVFAGRGVGVLAGVVARVAERNGVAPHLASALVVGVALWFPARSLARVEWIASQDNSSQLAVLSLVNELTGPRDAAYDNSGSYVARPSASFYFYTDAPMRARLGEMLANRIPEDILRAGAVLFLHDARTGGLPESLRAFLGRHFKPYTGDVWLWGQTYVADPGGRVSSRFTAVRTDRYVVVPGDAIARGVLLVDGRRVDRPVFEIPAGEHDVTWDGPPAFRFHLLWLPRNGKPWTPDVTARPGFSRVL